ncbi:MAG: tetratricopeptide repeat protein [Candidatus Glassbacteria bacterium]|nr:tetratricopeptide repeat protein [Candidatus Glassbacteria bacterium]
MRPVTRPDARNVRKAAGFTLVLLLIALAGLWAALPEETGYFQLLKEKYQSDPVSYAAALTDELSIFRDIYPGSVKMDSVEFFLADLYDKNRNEAAALATYLKIVFVYPSSPLIPPCLLNLQRLAGARKDGITSLFADDELKALKGFVLKILEDELTSGGGQAGYLEFIRVLSDAAVVSLAQYTINECRHYLYRLGYEEQADRVAVIRGDMHCLRKEWRRAIVAYRTVPLIAPYGDAVAESILKTGDIYFRRLEDFRMASDIYRSVIEQYPSSIEAARASVYLAEVDEAQKNYARAVLQLEDTAKRFPFPEIRMDSYARIARLFLERQDNTEKAILFYERHVSEYPEDPRSAEILIRIGDLYEKKTKDYSGAIGAYRRLAELFPAKPTGPVYLLRAAELADTRLNDPVLAAALYEQLARDYPKSEEGKKAAETLRKRKKN